MKEKKPKKITKKVDVPTKNEIEGIMRDLATNNDLDKPAEFDNKRFEGE